MQSYRDLGDLIDEILYTSYYGWGSNDDNDIPGVPSMIAKGKMQSGLLEIKDHAVYAILDDMEREIDALRRRFRHRLHNRAPGERWECPLCCRSNHRSISYCACGWTVGKGLTNK